jgi:hypothetical protein
MDSNCKPIHAPGYTVPRSVEQKLLYGKKIVRLMEIEVLEVEADYSSKRTSPSFEIPKKNETIGVVTYFRKLKLLLKRRMSSISYSKDWGHD